MDVAKSLSPLESDVFQELAARNPGVSPERLRKSYWRDRFEFVAWDGPPLVDLSPLARLEDLEWVKLRGCAVADLSPLAGLTRLTQVEVSGNRAALPPCDFTGLARLEALILSDADAALPKLDGLQRLKRVHLHHCGLTDLTPLAGLPALQSVWAAENPELRDLSPLRACPALQELTVYQTGVTDLSPLRGLAELRRLTASFTGVTDVAPLAGCPALELVWLYDTPVAEVGCLAELPRLKSLNLRKTAVADLSAFRGREDILEIERKKLDTVKKKRTAAQLRAEAVRLGAKLAQAGADLRPPLTAAEVKAFEKRWGVRLPGEYAAFLTLAGDGCRGPVDVKPLELAAFDPEHLADQFPLRDAWVWEDDENASDARILAAARNGQLELTDLGCGRSFRLIVTGSARGEVWELADVGMGPYRKGVDFLRWLGDLVDGKLS